MVTNYIKGFLMQENDCSVDDCEVVLNQLLRTICSEYKHVSGNDWFTATEAGDTTPECKALKLIRDSLSIATSDFVQRTRTTKEAEARRKLIDQAKKILQMNIVSGDHKTFLDWPASEVFTAHLKDLMSSRQILCSPMLNNYLVAFFSVGPTLKKRFLATTQFASEQYSYRSNTTSTKTFVFGSEAEERPTITKMILDNKGILFRIPSTVVEEEPIRKRLRTERGAAVVALNAASRQTPTGTERPQDNRAIAPTFHRRQSGREKRNRYAQ